MQPIQIIATIGPSCNNIDTIERMITAGMSIARLNFSWGTHEEHRAFVAMVREAADRVGRVVPIIQDISGPRVQTGSTHTFSESLDVLTVKDRADVAALADLSIEYIAQSFVKDAADIESLRAQLREVGSNSKVIAKIERSEAVTNKEAIATTADGLMVARGDLGEAVPYYTLPFVKKALLGEAITAGVPAIVATEMLTSMIDDTDPTRADISDIAHAVLDGASATMLSNETAVGSNPVEVVAVMRAVVDEAQQHATCTNQARF